MFNWVYAKKIILRRRRSNANRNWKRVKCIVEPKQTWRRNPRNWNYLYTRICCCRFGSPVPLKNELYENDARKKIIKKIKRCERERREEEFKMVMTTGWISGWVLHVLGSHDLPPECILWECVGFKNKRWSLRLISYDSKFKGRRKIHACY